MKRSTPALVLLLTTLALIEPNTVASQSTGQIDSVSASLNKVTSTVEVRYEDINRHVTALWSPGAAWHYTDLVAATNSPILPDNYIQSLPGTYDQTFNTTEAYYVAAGTHDIIQLWFNGSWHSQDLTAMTATPNTDSMASLTANFDPITNTSQLFYKGNDSDIHVLFSRPDGSWTSEDLTAITGSSTAANRPFVALYDPLFNTTEVYYVNTNNHVIQLFFQSASGWHSQDLSEVTGAPHPDGASGIAGIHDAAFNDQEIFYTDANGDMQELFSDASGGWHSQDLTQLAGVLAGTPNQLTAVYDPILQRSEVFYITFLDTLTRYGYDVCEMFYSNGWHAQDLTASVVTSRIPGPASLYMSSIYDPYANTVELYYLTNHDIEQMFFNGVGWQAQDLTVVTGAPPAF